jgi:hypothetical protein
LMPTVFCCSQKLHGCIGMWLGQYLIVVTSSM